MISPVQFSLGKIAGVFIYLGTNVIKVTCTQGIQGGKFSGWVTLARENMDDLNMFLFMNQIRLPRLRTSPIHIK